MTDTFFGSRSGIDGELLILGAPFDRGSVEHAGCAAAPSVLRRMSSGLGQSSGGFWDYARGRRVLRKIRIADAGDLTYRGTMTRDDYLARLAQASSAIVETRRRLLVVGGDHLITLGVLRGVSSVRPIQIVQIDAHSDIQPTMPGAQPTHANFMSYLLPLKSVRRVIRIGLRGVGRTAPSRDAKLAACAPSDLGRHLLPRLGVYLTIDSDGFDPAAMPAVSYPVPNGLAFNDLLDVLDQIKSSGCDLVGADWTEFNPKHDTPNAIGQHFVLNGLIAVAGCWESIDG